MSNIIRDGLTWMQRYDALVADGAIEKIKTAVEGIKWDKKYSLETAIKTELKTSSMLNVPLEKILPHIIQTLKESE